MKVKRYVTRTLQEAMDKIRIELGKEAIILNTKRIRTGGFLGLFQKVEVEVLAAIDSEKAGSRTLNIHQPEKQPSLVTSSLEIKSTDLLEADSSSRVTMPESVILNEVKEMREMITNFMNNRVKESSFPPIFNRVIDRLHQQEVDFQLITYLVDEVLKKRMISEIKENEVFSLVRNEMIGFLSEHMSGAFDPETRLYHVVGPTGVGKTTTIAKLAAHFMLKHNKKIGFITSDTYRIAAIEQLKTYANILNVPIEVVYNTKELNQAITKLVNVDLIIMDTAGRNYRNKQYVQDLSKLLTSTIRAETILALSLTAKYDDMVAIVRQFAELKVNKVIFTKLDETTTFGSIINLIYYYKLNISYITNGQTVPDDMFAANPEQITNLILGGEEHE